MTEREKRDIIIDDILQPSLCRLYEMDYDNIRFGVSERNERLISPRMPMDGIWASANY